ncbi:hypothetical protein [Bacillus sp. AFS096315]|uniref:hypothetical protein n=1 Tax=Bacillus sp. AFS096315 TaxID=2033517 RepID=UPI000BEB3E73|nr:hypothetical protein [Bacillus sp. AFS096315]PEC46377.1 hypothetical protein CON00_23945 [Bacillus sp. AFS096315]
MNNVHSDTSAFYDSLKPDGSKEKIITFEICATKGKKYPEVDFNTVFTISPQYEVLRPVFEFINNELTRHIRSIKSEENSLLLSMDTEQRDSTTMDAIKKELCSFYLTYDGEFIGGEANVLKGFETVSKYSLRVLRFVSNYLENGLNNYASFIDEELPIETYELFYEFSLLSNKNHFEVNYSYIHPYEVIDAIEANYQMNYGDIIEFIESFANLILEDSNHKTSYIMKVRTNFLLIEKIWVW